MPPFIRLYLLHPPLYFTVYLSIYLPIYRVPHLTVCLSVCLFVFLLICFPVFVCQLVFISLSLISLSSVSPPSLSIFSSVPVRLSTCLYVNSSHSMSVCIYLFLKSSHCLCLCLSLFLFTNFHHFSMLFPFSSFSVSSILLLILVSLSKRLPVYLVTHYSSFIPPLSLPFFHFSLPVYPNA